MLNEHAALLFLGICYFTAPFVFVINYKNPCSFSLDLLIGILSPS